MKPARLAGAASFGVIGVDPERPDAKLPEMWSRPAAASVALVLLAAGSACGDDERPPPLADASDTTAIPGCEDFSYRPCDILSDTCQSELFALMACARNEELAAIQLPPVLLMSEEDAVATISAAAARVSGAEPNAGFATEVRALEMLGLVEAGLLERESDVISVTVGSIVAFYLIPTREIVIIDRGEPLDDLDANATLAHELVHSMQDARHGLAQFTGAHSPSSDASLAASSLVEGEATFYQLLMMFTYDGVDLDSVDYRVTLDNLADIGSGMTLDAGSPMVTATGIFPYTHGARYAGAHWLKGQEPALDALYATPPESSLEVMTGGWTGAPPELFELETAPEPLAGHSAVSDDVAGAYVVFGLLGLLSPSAELSPSLEELAGRWRGDRIWTYQRDDETASVAALWAIAWDDADAAASAADVLAGWSMDGVALDVSVYDRTVRITAVEDGTDLEAWVARLAAIAPE